MALRYYLGAPGSWDYGDATEIESRIRFVNPASGDESPGFEQSAEGTDAAIVRVEFDDPGADYTGQVWLPFWASEDLCDPPRVWTGFIANLDYSRKDYTAADERTIAGTLVDLNTLLKFSALLTASARRPVETDTARLAWLLSEPLAGVVFDTGLVDTTGQNVFEGDFVTQYAVDVIASAASAMVRDAYLIWDHEAPVGEQVALVFESRDEAQRISPLSLSNVAADFGDPVDDSEVFPISQDSVLERTGEELYCQDVVIWRGGRAVAHSQTTHDTYFGDATGHRTRVTSSERIGLAATAETTAEANLVAFGVPRDIITTRVRLPAEKVNHILPGQAIDIKASHFEGYEDFTTVKVLRRNVTEVSPGDDGRYDVDLKLSNAKAAAAPGGGPGGEGPFEPCTPVEGAVGVYGTFATSGDMGDPLPGVWFGGEGSGTVAYADRQVVPSGAVISVILGIDDTTDRTTDIESHGWTVEAFTQLAEAPGSLYALWQIADGVLDIYQLTTDPQAVRIGAIAMTGADTPPTSGSLDTSGTNYPITITPAEANSLVHAGVGIPSSFSQCAMSGDPLYTQILVSEKASRPRVVIQYREGLPAAAQTVAAQLCVPASLAYIGVVMAWAPTDPDADTDDPDCSPDPGQEVPPQPWNTPTPSFGPAGTVFTVPFGTGYEPGSLRVWLDDQPQPGVIEVDPSAGTFSLTFDVLPSEVLTLAWTAASPAASCPLDLQDAIDATASGGTLNITGCVYSGEYTIDAPMTLLGGKLDQADYTTGQALTISGDDVNVIGIEVTRYRRAISITGATDTLVQGAHIHHVGRTGIEAQQASVRPVLDHNHIHDTGLIGDGNAEAIYIGSARSSAGWTTPDLTRDGTISDNTIYNVPGDGIDVKDDVTGFTVSGNLVHHCTEADTGAINIRGYDNTIDGNTCRDNTASGFRFGGTPAGVAINVVTDNVSNDNTGYGFKCTDGPQTTFTGNTGSGNGDGFSTGCT